MVHLADYKIKIPNTVVNNIAEDIQVTVDVNLEAIEKVADLNQSVKKLLNSKLNFRKL